MKWSTGVNIKHVLSVAFSAELVAFAGHPGLASELATSPMAEFAALSHASRAGLFLPGRAVRIESLRASGSARRRPAALPACHSVTVTFPADVGQPPNAPVMLTAALVDPASIKGPVDATGCDVGIYLDSSSAGARILDVEIHDANQFGVLAVGAQNVSIVNATIFRIGNHDSTGFNPNGVQTGVGIDFEGGTGVVADAFITQYQKNGTAFDFGASVSIVNSSVIGLGSVNYIAQNGVQWYESVVRGAVNVFTTANHYNNPSDPTYNGEATGFLVLCTNLRTPVATSIFNAYDTSFDNDYNFYISNNTTDGDCPAGYKT
jgi:hypothetical protein